MGLDQYLYRRNEKGIDVEEIYWRKANFVHRYFTEDYLQRGYESDNLTPFTVTREDLRRLADLCGEVLEHKDDAPQLLPTESGFFFGSTEYGDWYFEDVEFTRGEIEKLLAEANGGDTFYYEAWY